ncbi:MAG: AI-2E family transporter [Dethiosulfovibrio peptidovorans]|nr:MAG: AI-2E family transporter [Dethiosulfovibrio peptidovorans]
MKNVNIVVACVFILTLVAVGSVLKATQSVILPFVIAWLLSYIFSPVVRAMARRRIPMVISMALVLAVLLGVCFLVAVFMNTRIVAFASAYPKYYDQLIALTKSFTNSKYLPPDFWDSINWGESVGRYLLSLSGSLVSLLSKLVLVVVFLVFMLLGTPYVEFKIKKAFSIDSGARVLLILKAVSAQIGRYLTLQFLISMVTGLFVWLSLSYLKVDFAATWGVLAFALNFIPTIGSIMASVPPILLALVQYYPNTFPAVGAAVALLFIQMIIGNVVTPKIMGDTLDLSPVVILISLFFWGWLWGVVGALLSVPIAAIIKIICENVESLHVIGVMMGSGRSYRRDLC